jgi:hypothetical protein
VGDDPHAMTHCGGTTAAGALRSARCDLHGGSARPPDELDASIDNDIACHSDDARRNGRRRTTARGKSLF